MIDMHNDKLAWIQPLYDMLKEWYNMTDTQNVNYVSNMKL